MRRKPCNRTGFLSYAATYVCRLIADSVTLGLWNNKIKCMSYFYARNSQHGLVNSYIGEYIVIISGIILTLVCSILDLNKFLFLFAMQTRSTSLCTTIKVAIFETWENSGSLLTLRQGNRSLVSYGFRLFGRSRERMRKADCYVCHGQARCFRKRVRVRRTWVGRSTRCKLSS